MPVSNAQFTITEGTRSLIATADNMTQDVIIHEADHSQSSTTFLGDENVTNLTGLHIHNGETLQLTLRPGDELYAYAQSGNPSVHVIQIQKAD